MEAGHPRDLSQIELPTVPLGAISSTLWVGYAIGWYASFLCFYLTPGNLAVSLSFLFPMR